jgi:hypothetical protein
MQRADLVIERDLSRVPLLTRFLLTPDPATLGTAPATIDRVFARRSSSSGSSSSGSTGERRTLLLLLHGRGGAGGFQGLRCLGTCRSFAEQERLYCVGEVLHQMEPICYLLGVWRSSLGSVGISAPAITANDFTTWMALKPGGEALTGTVGKHIHRTMPFQVDEQGAIGLPFASCPVVYA